MLSWLCWLCAIIHACGELFNTVVSFSDAKWVRLRWICLCGWIQLADQNKSVERNGVRKGNRVHKPLHSPSFQAVPTIGYLQEAYNNFITIYSTMEYGLRCPPPPHPARCPIWWVSGIVRQQQKTASGNTDLQEKVQRREGHSYSYILLLSYSFLPNSQDEQSCPYLTQLVTFSRNISLQRICKIYPSCEIAKPSLHMR